MCRPVRSILPIVVLFVAASLQAQTRLTYTGTIKNSSTISSEYFGQAVELSIVTSGNPSASFNPNFAINASHFYDDIVGDDADLFQSVTGTHITGTYQRPVSLSYSPYATVTLDHGFDNISFFISSDDGSGVGLDFLGIAITALYGDGYLTPALSTPSGYPSVNYSTIWDEYHGTYVSSNGYFGFVVILANGQIAEFDMASLVIESASAVPEPSTYGLMLGGLALAGAAIRRRKVA